MVQARCRDQHLSYVSSLLDRTVSRLLLESVAIDTQKDVTRGVSRGIAPMATAEIASPSKHMTPKLFITIPSAKKIMIMQLIVEQYYYS